MKKFTKEMSLGEALKNHKNTDKVLMGFGMHCFSCPFSQMETIEQACMVHGLDVDLVLEKLNELEAPKLPKTIKLSKAKDCKVTQSKKPAKK